MSRGAITAVIRRTFLSLALSISISLSPSLSLSLPLSLSETAARSLSLFRSIRRAPYQLFVRVPLVQQPINRLLPPRSLKDNPINGNPMLLPRAAHAADGLLLLANGRDNL